MRTDNPIARAFELAREGTCQTVNDFRIKLVREGYGNAHLHFESPTFKRQLRELIKSGGDKS